jgi:multiple sugar transport system substrate-binding protein
MKRWSAALISAGLLLAAALPARADDTVFLTTQLRPIEEATKLREEILKGTDGVNVVAEEPQQFAVRVQAEGQTGTHTISLLGALHGELEPLPHADALQPLDDLAQKLADRNFPKGLLELGKLGTAHQQYIPWMQATYVMVANKEALQYLPQGADINALTYDQLIAWGGNLEKATGEKRIGFPVGPKGLMPRFLEGYFYPSFTGGVVRPFKSAEAEKAWASLKALWAVTTPNSTNYDFMQEPLLAGEVWVAWDHAARVKEALASQPDQFVVFPAPTGPHGRGYMPVVAGLAIPKGAPNAAVAAAVIEHLTKPETQIITAQQVGFFPVTQVKLPADLAPDVKMLADAIAATQNAKDALVSLLPIGLGDKGGEFNKIYMDTFQRVVLQGEAIPGVLDEQGAKLDALMKQQKAPCWAPDKASDGACPVE